MTSLLLGDLNDYIQPSVECTKPNPVSMTSPSDSSSPPASEASIVINLNDCLACSGCITSAETVLVTQQTHQQLYDILAQNSQISSQPIESQPRYRHVVVSVSAASQAALAHRFELTLVQVWRKLLYFFRHVLGGVHTVIDGTFGFCLALRAAADEFMTWHEQQNGRRDLPLLASECPGWICFAEKRQTALLGQICTVRSPQQILGALLKHPEYQADLQEKLVTDSIFHVSIQPCFDKKLEASRVDFRLRTRLTSDTENKKENESLEEEREVDCVIATTELLTMLQEKLPGYKFSDLPEEPLSPDDPFRMFQENQLDQFQLWRYEGSSAGGYLLYILRAAAWKLFHIVLLDDLTKDEHLTIEHHRNNADYAEYTLRDSPGGKVCLRMAAIYGFRNIQTFVQRLRQHRIEYHYVEVMACPGACLFGGGQPRGLPSGATRAEQAEHRRHMWALLEQDTVKPPSYLDEASPLTTGHIDRVWQWIQSDPERVKTILHTSYHPISDADKKRPAIHVTW